LRGAQIGLFIEENGCSNFVTEELECEDFIIKVLKLLALIGECFERSTVVNEGLEVVTNNFDCPT
jgi:hypothetical protein